ncbi:TetR-like C-terminal domain-containing protein, partial [Actinosynnema sp.]
GDEDGANATRCSDYAADQVTLILDRARARSERPPPLEAAMDHLVSPLVYRILFRPTGLDAAYARRLVAELLGGPTRR